VHEEEAFANAEECHRGFAPGGICVARHEGGGHVGRKNWGVACLHEEWIGMCCLERVLDLDENDIKILINHHSSIYLRWIGLLFRTQGPKNHWCC